MVSAAVHQEAQGLIVFAVGTLITADLLAKTPSQHVQILEVREFAPRWSRTLHVGRKLLLTYSDSDRTWRVETADNEIPGLSVDIDSMLADVVLVATADSLMTGGCLLHRVALADSNLHFERARIKKLQSELSHAQRYVHRLDMLHRAWKHALLRSATDKPQDTTC